MVEIRKTMRLNPAHPDRYLYALGLSNYVMRRYEKAIPPLKEVVERASTTTWGRQPSRWWFRLRSRMLLIASYAAAGQLAQAKAMAGEYRERLGQFDPKEWVPRKLRFKNRADAERLIENLIKAGLK